MGATFALAWLVTRARALRRMALVWTGYALYELLMATRILCTGECNIRVDLLLIFPGLAIGSLVAIWMAIRARMTATSPPPP